VGAGCSKRRWCNSGILMGSAVYTRADEKSDTLIAYPCIRCIEIERKSYLCF